MSAQVVSSTNVELHLSLIQGLGGICKTQLALEAGLLQGTGFSKAVARDVSLEWQGSRSSVAVPFRLFTRDWSSKEVVALGSESGFNGTHGRASGSADVRSRS